MQELYPRRGEKRTIGSNHRLVLFVSALTVRGLTEFISYRILETEGDTTYESNDDPRRAAGYRCNRRVAGLCNGHRGEGRDLQATERVTGHGNSQRRQRLQRAS